MRNRISLLQETGFKTALCMLALALFVCLISACGGAGNAIDTDASEGGAGADDTGAYTYKIYTVDISTNSLSDKQEYVTYETDNFALAEELIDIMMEEAQIIGCASAYPDEISRPEINVSTELITLGFGAEYYDMDVVTEILCRAATVKTLTQIPGIKYVYFMVENKPLCDAYGEYTGYMQASDFITDVSTEEEAITREFTLYFLDEEGFLVPVEEELTYASHTLPETAVVRALIEGPEDDVYKATISQTVTLNVVQTRDEICYVNFGNEFLTDATGAAADIVIDSIVLSLLELDNINGVQILVDGSSDILYRDLIQLDQVFEGEISDNSITESSAEAE